MKATIELEVEVEYTYDPGERARLSGPPEDCCPETPESIEIISVMFKGTDIVDDLTEDQLSDLSEAARQDMLDRAADAAEAKAEARAEERWEDGE